MALKTLLSKLSPKSLPTSFNIGSRISILVEASPTPNNVINETTERSPHADDTSLESISRSTSKASRLELLASQKKWDEMLEVATNMWRSGYYCPVTGEEGHNTQQQVAVSSDYPVEAAPTAKGTTPLHEVMPYQPPVNIVDKLIGMLKTSSKFSIPAPEEYKDDLDRTPLHIAAEYGCQEGVVERLLDGDLFLMPALARDSQGWTPLHTAVASPLVEMQTTRSKKNGKTMKKLLLRPGTSRYKKAQRRKTNVVQRLLHHYVSATTLVDDHGKTPVDYAPELSSSLSLKKKNNKPAHHFDTTILQALLASSVMCHSLAVEMEKNNSLQQQEAENALMRQLDAGLVAVAPPDEKKNHDHHSSGPVVGAGIKKEGTSPPRPVVCVLYR